MFIAELLLALDMLKRAFGWDQPPTPAPASGSRWTPESVEAAIEAAGRSEVFAEARRLGWTDGYAPLWVWGNIASEVSARRAPAPTIH